MQKIQQQSEELMDLFKPAYSRALDKLKPGLISIINKNIRKFLISQQSQMKNQKTKNLNNHRQSVSNDSNKEISIDQQEKQ